MSEIKLLAAALLSAFSLQQTMAQTFVEATYAPTQTSFRLFAPGSAKQVQVRIYDKGEGGKPVKTIRMENQGNDTFTAVAPGDMLGKFYTFDIGRGETPGIFAKAVGVNGKRAALIDMSKTNPAGWDNDPRPVTRSMADLVIYEMHHRDFSISPSVDIKNRGKFLALTEPAAINHLKQLGVNAVHILPSFDYASVDETKLNVPQYNWGYDPVNYNVPEGSYSTDPYNPATRINEFKQMVMALHKAGIRVILDVVYNHTFDMDGSNFERTYPGYFYRMTAGGKPSDGSGCGNETASEKEMMRRFILESVLYWMQEYHIDGFRFDLMGIHDIRTMNLVQGMVKSLNPNAFVYGEGWSAGQCAYPQDKLAMKANMSQMPGIAAFGDEMRDALRGPFSDDHKGAFLAAIPGFEESVKFGIVGAISHPQIDYGKVNYSNKPWAAEPTQMISYVSCHDDMCLTDRLQASIPGLTFGEMIRLDLLAQTAVFTSQGVPFILGGEEMLRSKKGVHNSFCSPDSINELDWHNMQRYPMVVNYYKALIAMRHNHPAFRLGKADLVRKHLSFLPAGDNVVAFMLKDNAGGDKWNNIIVVLNANRHAARVPVPEGEYTVVCRGMALREGGMGTVRGGTVTVEPQSALIIHQ